MPTCFRADRIRAAWIAFPGDQRIISPLAISTANWMNGRKVQDVETHPTNSGQLRNNVFEVPMHAWFRALRARKQFVPAGEFRSLPVDCESVDAGRHRIELAGIGLAHRLRGC